MLNCYGLPGDLLTVREYGGSYDSTDKKYEYTAEDFTHILNFTGVEHINIPWHTSSYDSMYPDTIEFKAQTNQ